MTLSEATYDELLRRAAPFLRAFNPDQERDEKGRFAPGSGKEEDGAGDAFNERADSAAKGKAALDAAPADRRGGFQGRRDDALKLTRDEREALDEYGSDAQEINRQIREGDMTSQTEEIVGQIDGVMERSRLEEDALVWRGVTSGDVVFGEGATAADLTGTRWTEDAFVSTTADRGVAEAFAGMFNPDEPPVVMRMVAPKGVGAVAMSPYDGAGNPLMGGQAELVLERGLSMEVVADHGVVSHPMIPAGVRMVDVEVSGSGGGVRSVYRRLLWELPPLPGGAP